MWCNWDGSGALFPKSYFPDTVLQVLPTLSLSLSRLWLSSPLCQLPVGAAESQQHRREARSVFCWQLCTPHLSLPVRQSRAQHPYITSGYTIHCTTKWTGKQFNVKAQSQEKLKLPERLDLQTVVATYIAYYFAEVQDLGFRNIRHLLVASQHTYIPIIFWNIKYWLLFIRISPCYQVHLHIKNKWI